MLSSVAKWVLSITSKSFMFKFTDTEVSARNLVLKCNVS